MVLSRKACRPKLRRFDRLLLAAVSRVLPKDRWASFLVTPATLLRWHRELVPRKWTYRHKRTGRPSIDPEIYALVCRMARENPRWGYIRIQGECRKLGIRVGATIVKRILDREGLGPAPRCDGPSWSKFLRAPASGIIACGRRQLCVVRARRHVIQCYDHDRAGMRRCPFLADPSAVSAADRAAR